jgi:hypothetical protein
MNESAYQSFMRFGACYLCYGSDGKYPDDAVSVNYK